MSPRFAFVVVLTLMSAYLVYQAMELRSIGREDYLTPAIAAAGSPQVINGKSAGLALKEVATQNLFGKPYANQVAKASDDQPAQKNIPVTTLKLTLTAVIGSSDEKKASAFIENEKKVSERYFVGDQISAGVTLHAIEDESVILSRNGKLETLRYPAAASQPAAVAPVPAPQPQPVTTAAAVPEQASQPAQQGDYDANGNPSQSLRMRLKRMALEARRKKIRENQQQSTQ